MDYSYLLVATVSFMLGFPVGYITAKVKPISFSEDKNARFFVIFLIGLAWFMSVIVDMNSPSYETSPYIHGLMGLVAGYFVKKALSSD